MIMAGGSDVRVKTRRAEHCLTLSLVALVSTGFAGLASLSFPTSAEAKTPGSTYCYYGTCHRVKTISETSNLVGSRELVQASFYDDCKNDTLNPCGLTSSGEVFRPGAPDNAASPIYPDGTTLLVWSPQSKTAAVLRVNNAGPYWGGRTLDVSRAAAEALGFKPVGVAQLKVHVLDAPTAAEATYRRHRRYNAVPGPMGQYNSMDEALLSLAVMRAFDEMPTTLLTHVGDASTALTANIAQDELAIEVPEVVVAAIAKAPAKSVMKTVQKRLDAKAKRIASKRKAHLARKNGARRSTVASRRQARGARYAQSRSPRYAQSRKAGAGRVVAQRKSIQSRSRVVRRQLRGVRPIVTRSRAHRRVAEALMDRMTPLGLQPRQRLLRDLPNADRTREEKLILTPVNGPVQVV